MPERAFLHQLTARIGDGQEKLKARPKEVEYERHEESRPGNPAEETSVGLEAREKPGGNWSELREAQRNGEGDPQGPG